jgi:hypothetical protein
VVGPVERARFVERLGQSDREPTSPVMPSDIARLIASDELPFDDVKTIMRGVRYSKGYDEKFAYADSLVPEASDFLRPYELRALVRAEISEKEALNFVKRDKAFFHRLAGLLPAILKLFGDESKRRIARGIIGAVDDCHNDFHYALNSSRRDRQIREAKAKLTRASRLALDAAKAIKEADEHFKHEYGRYREVHYLPAPGPARFIDDLIDELEMCAGVLEITHVTADIKPKRLFLFGNDHRMAVVEKAYHMCCMWQGPKLVTTPGSNFSVLCSLLFEAVSGKSDEGLAGAINRYARSAARKQWDQEGENDDPDDNFQSEKARMVYSAEQIELCKTVLQKPGLSDRALKLLEARIKREEQQYEEARTAYGPRQVYLEHMNQQQWEAMLVEAMSRLKPEQLAEIDERIKKGQSLAAGDMEWGQTKRAAQRKVDVNSERERT